MSYQKVKIIKAGWDEIENDINKFLTDDRRVGGVLSVEIAPTSIGSARAVILYSLRPSNL